MIGGREEREREMNAAAVSSTANHALGSPTASLAMDRVLQLSLLFFTGVFEISWALGLIVFGAAGCA
jgi:hypothetical protein